MAGHEQTTTVWVYHHSWRSEFRQPFGAVCCGANVRLAFRTPPAETLRKVTLRLWLQGQGERLVSLEDAGEGFWQVDYETPEEPGWLWYHFIAEEMNGTVWYYGASEDGLGGLGYRRSQPGPRSWQITVHQQQAAPKWLTDGVIYQIFPDRFCNGQEKGEIRGAQPGSLLHAHWEDVPFYVRDVDTGHMVAYDFFGGNLEGICSKLSYLADLGVTILYLNPIFLSVSNHRYDVADYHQIDPMLGETKDLVRLCKKAKDLGMHVILDGVFSHTGSDSIYFNKEGRFPGVGAYQSKESPYYSWYRFKEYPEDYEAWWGIGTMPNVDEVNESYLDFIIRGPNSVLRHWLRCGVKGWRLDVVDELPDAFLEEFYRVLKEEDPEAVLIGEVWEDASRKESYGQMRRYLLGDELDSTMNYPFRKALLEFFLGRMTAQRTLRVLRSLQENYPAPHFYGAMNLVGSHDVPRVLTELGEAPPGETLSEKERAFYCLPEEQRLLALQRYRLLVLWQMTFPGVPSVYYGDEAGVEGYRDPFNRGTFPWGREDEELLAWHRALIHLRRNQTALRRGLWLPLESGQEDVLAFLRTIENGQDALGGQGEEEVLLIAVNRHETEERWLTVTDEVRFKGRFVSLVDETQQPVAARDGVVTLRLPPLSGVVLKREEASVLPRSAGLLLHPTSLPGPYGGGDLGPEARKFVDFLARAGQSWWQMLPLNQPGPASCGSPYQALSAFAGNVALLSPDDLVTDGWLSAADLEPLSKGINGVYDWESVTAYKEQLIRRAFERLQPEWAAAPDYTLFCQCHGDWLKDYALFRAAKNRYKGLPWTQWPQGLRERRPVALDELRRQEGAAVELYQFEQFLFFKQARRLRDYANQQGVKLLGDLPLYVAHDSSDVWSRQLYFLLDSEGEPSGVAGVPPDYFSKDGQLWGNPLYDWKAMGQQNYRWWRRRLEVVLEVTDWVRLDHFRGIEAYWEVPAAAETAVEGCWQPGPGAALLAALRQEEGVLPLVAEDLGIITPEVDALKEAFSLPGMAVLQFAFRQTEDGVKYPLVSRNTIVYTGTHDNDTSRSWFETLARQDPGLASDIARLLQVRGGGVEAVVRALIRYAYACDGDVAILPVQDVLGLGREGRMNVPGVAKGNWSWRLSPGALGERQAVWLAELCEQYGRKQC
ncbi:4-alpha-glucanotransferase [Anaeroarcus burkinensis]|uniref:4-alpha-glucanotransferase n=1 Tax=Anaeroarcus burkinensis TaxID=82376 RepID=UPI0005672D0D|nr:4-alpha-glucanotransferase [Anaeroarcus burkinensis]